MSTPIVAQRLTLELDGILAEDYLAWVRDPEPRALGGALRSVHARALAEQIDVRLVWDREPPAPRDAAALAGFPLTPQVVAVRPMRRRSSAAGRRSSPARRRRVIHS